jgi:hypothetical protein
MRSCKSDSLLFLLSERAKGASHQAGEVLIVYGTAHSIELTFHALCDTVDETVFGFFVPAASYPDDQEKVWQRYRIQYHLSALLWLSPCNGACITAQ